MKHIITLAASAPASELDLCRWIGAAFPGDILEYHRGFLALDTACGVNLAPQDRKALRLLAARARWASDAGFVHLAQRRIGDGVFAYLAIKRSRGFVEPPAIDPEGGRMRDLRTCGVE